MAHWIEESLMLISNDKSTAVSPEDCPKCKGEDICENNRNEYMCYDCGYILGEVG